MPDHLARGNVDAGEDRRRDLERLLPGREFAGGGVEREDPDVGHDAGSFRLREEIGGAEYAQSRMPPAREASKPATVRSSRRTIGWNRMLISPRAERCRTSTCNPPRVSRDDRISGMNRNA